jgi:hypothetical protein
MPAQPYRAPATSVPVSSQVEAYDELTYRCKADDNFARISQQFFQSDKYARALQLFNRNHPRATEALLQEPPYLAGQSVYIPPLRILEKYYGSAIQDLKPLPTIPAPASGGAVPPSGPVGSTSRMPPQLAPASTVASVPTVPPVAMPAAGAPAAPVARTPAMPTGTPAAPAAAAVTASGPSAPPAAIQPAGAWATPNAPRFYRVKTSGGEMYRDIAAKTLNNRDRWGEIYQMNNRQFPPEYPVPPGTMLRLPPDARVSPADAQ